MKTVILAAAVAILPCVSTQPAHASVSFDLAYSNLSEHGSWLVSAQYGRVWQPREYNQGWNPYYDGHWVNSDMGWAWVSNYQWGSIPYHYGTWYMDPRMGWVWIPGEVWAPSWVVFRTTPEYIGWAPVPPGFSVGVSMQFGSPSSFVYVSSRNFMSPNLRTQFIPAAQTNVFMNNTTVVNNIVIQNNVVVNRGPDVRMIERATGQTFRPQPIEQVARVAPFTHVSRAELAVAPESVKQGVRVDRQVPESQPLPSANKMSQPNSQPEAAAPVPAPAQTRSNSPGHKNNQAPSQQTAPLATAPQTQSAPNSRTNPQHGQQPARTAPAPSQQTAPVATAPQTQSAPNSRTNPQHGQQPARTAPAPAPAPAASTAKASPQHDPKAQPAPKPDPNAKAKADQKAKKEDPAKKDDPVKKQDPAKQDKD